MRASRVTQVVGLLAAVGALRHDRRPVGPRRRARHRHLAGRRRHGVPDARAASTHAGARRRDRRDRRRHPAGSAAGSPGVAVGHRRRPRRWRSRAHLVDRRAAAGASGHRCAPASTWPASSPRSASGALVDRRVRGAHQPADRLRRARRCWPSSVASSSLVAQLTVVPLFCLVRNHAPMAGPIERLGPVGADPGDHPARVPARVLPVRRLRADPGAGVGRAAQQPLRVDGAGDRGAVLRDPDDDLGLRSVRERRPALRDHRRTRRGSCWPRSARCARS